MLIPRHHCGVAGEREGGGGDQRGVSGGGLGSGEAGGVGECDGFGVQDQDVGVEGGRVSTLCMCLTKNESLHGRAGVSLPAKLPTVSMERLLIDEL
jgi:hypothetical protein